MLLVKSCSPTVRIHFTLWCRKLGSRRSLVGSLPAVLEPFVQEFKWDPVFAVLVCRGATPMAVEIVDVDVPEAARRDEATTRPRLADVSTAAPIACTTRKPTSHQTPPFAAKSALATVKIARPRRNAPRPRTRSGFKRVGAASSR
jgi:hypothetical protein